MKLEKFFFLLTMRETSTAKLLNHMTIPTFQCQPHAPTRTKTATAATTTGARDSRGPWWLFFFLLYVNNHRYETGNGNHDNTRLDEQPPPRTAATTTCTLHNGNASRDDPPPSIGGLFFRLLTLQIIFEKQRQQPSSLGDYMFIFDWLLTLWMQYYKYPCKDTCGFREWAQWSKKKSVRPPTRYSLSEWLG